jgi:predicted Zn-dependent protease
MPFGFRTLSFFVCPVLYSWLFLTAGSTLLPAQTACPAPAGWVKPVSGDLFSDEQEVWLGDAMADMIENEYTIVKDPAENAYLEKIGARLLAALPPTKIRFRFVLIDSAEVNGFSLAGGRVYLTRKLVSNAHSEDEIAGVAAHEIGHIVTHQSAAEISEQMHRMLGVTSIGDRADVYEKFRRLMDARRNDKKRHNDPDSDPNQNQADRVAVYAMAVAGYQPQAYAEFWDRSFFVQGKTGGPLSDFFGQTTPTQKRLRQLRQLVAELPKGCGAAATSATAQFHQWQNAVTPIKNQQRLLKRNLLQKKHWCCSRHYGWTCKGCALAVTASICLLRMRAPSSSYSVTPSSYSFDLTQMMRSPQSGALTRLGLPFTLQSFTSRSGVSPSRNCYRRTRSS